MAVNGDLGELDASGKIIKMEVSAVKFVYFYDPLVNNEYGLFETLTPAFDS